VALVGTCLAALLALLALVAGRHSGGPWQQALALRGSRRHTDGAGGARGHRPAAEEEEGEVTELLHVPMVELQVENVPWRVAKLLVPLSPEVARWWTEVDVSNFSKRLHHPLTGHPQVHVHVLGGPPLEINGGSVPGVHVAIELPDGAVLEACEVRPILVTAEFEPLAALGPIRALLVSCPVRAGGGGAMVTARSALGGRHPCRWLLLPWLLLLLPFVVGSSIGPMALLAGACLTLASIACLSFIIAALIVVVQRRCVSCTRRWRRLWRLRTLARRPLRISAAFGDTGPCCICLAESDQREKLIALLPCRHALHEECYSSWVRADAYPSLELICPLCRRRADAIGKLGP